MKIAILEPNHYHDELFLSWIDAFEAHGAQVDVLTTEDNIQRDVLSSCKGRVRVICLKRKVIKSRVSKSNSNLLIKLVFRFLGLFHGLFINAMNKFLMGRAVRSINKHYDGAVINTIDDIRYLRALESISIPAIAILHHGNVVTNNIYKKFLQKKNITIAALTRHVQEYIHRCGFSCEVLTPVVFPYIEIAQKRTRNVVIQGNIELARKDYEALMTCKGNQTVFEIIGRESAQLAELREFYHYYSVDSIIRFTTDCENYKNFYETIAQHSFLAFLLNKKRVSMLPYYLYKCTSSINLAIGLQLIPVIDRETAEIYDLLDIAIVYDNNINEAMELISRLDDNKIEEKQSKLLKMKESILESNRLVVKDFIDLKIKDIQIMAIS